MAKTALVKLTNTLVDRYLPYDKSRICVVDIETEGVDEETGSPVLSIGACVIDGSKGDLSNGANITLFYTTIDVNQSYALGFKPDPDTLKWISNLPEVVQKDMYEGKCSPREAMEAFRQFVYDIQAEDDVTTYFIGNAPSFDFGMIKHYFNVLCLDWPIEHWQLRDFRTVAGLGLIAPDHRQKIKESMGEVKEHNALWDACYEAKIFAETIEEIEFLRQIKLDLLAVANTGDVSHVTPEATLQIP